jgi:hypothetical protein
VANHTAEEIEIFCQEFILGEDLTRAYLKAKPNCKAKQNTIYVLANKMSSVPKVKERIEELRLVARNKSEVSFGVSVEWRVNMLRDIATAGMDTYIDSQGNKRRENLAASRAAVQTLNDMLGIDSDDADNKSQPLEIKFTISPAKANIETTNVERD